MNESINVLREIFSRRIFIISFGVIWALFFGLFTTVAYSFLVKEAFYVSIILLTVITWPIIVFLHDYIQNLQSIGLRNLTAGKALGWVAILFVVSIIYGLILPPTIMNLVNPQYLKDLEIGGLIYFFFPFIYLLLFGGLWWHFGLSKNVAQMVFFLTISLAGSFYLRGFTSFPMFLSFPVALVVFTYVFFVKDMKS